MQETPTPSGVTGQEHGMTTLLGARARLSSETLSIAFAAVLGLGLIFVAGFAEATVVHDAAHDQRHAIAFPCH
jgi:cobalt transporter subunit CbtB